MGKKVLIIGGVAGGASAAARIRRLDEQAEIIMFEKGPHVSFSNCSLPYYLSGIVENSEKLVLMKPDTFDQRYRIDARVHQKVEKINRKEKTVTVKSLVDGSTYEESYDKLVLAPGARPIVPPITGAALPHVFTVRNVDDITELQEYASGEAINNVTVVGGGFIGIEVAENFKLAGYNVRVVEFAPQIMAPYDEDMVQILHKEMMDQGVGLVLSDGVSEITETHVKTQKGKALESDLVVMAIGVRPETELAEDAGLELGETGAIKVNSQYVTNDPDIYAVGDAIEVHHKILNKPVRLALAGPAQKQARIASDHMYGMHSRNQGVIGSSSIKLFNLNAAATGINTRQADEAGLSYDYAYVMPQDKVGLMPESAPMHFKLIFEVPTGRVLGAQAIGKGNVDKRIDVIASVLMFNGTIEDVKDLELSYSPMLGTAKDVVNHAALVATNLLYDVYKDVKVSDVRGLVESGAFIIDAREPNEFANGHLKGAVNIPLSEFRDRLDEIPKDEPVYIHCRSSQRSYNMVMSLQHLGFGNIYNISGSFLGISLYEYAQDELLGREPIVTAYNFK